MRKKRKEIGEEAWKEHQAQIKRNKSAKYRKNNLHKVSLCRQNTKIKLIEYKGGKCIKCGYSKNYPSVYDFHHRNPEEKEFRISDGNTRSLEQLKKEVDKCDLVCANCHREIHADLFKEKLDNNKPV